MNSGRSTISGRDAALFAFGAGLMLFASRLLPPIAGRAIGAARSAMGMDPFEALANDHRKALALFDMLERTSDNATIRRTAILMQLKRMLTAHALAEEDVVYPLLRDQANADEVAHGLYREHAEMKVRLYELERMDKSDPRWITGVRALRALVEAHARHEEETEFPRLKAALNEREIARVSSDVQREKALLL